MSALVSLLESLSNSRSIVFIRDSSYGMPAVQSVHLVGLTVLLAAIVILNLRLAGVGMNGLVSALAGTTAQAVGVGGLDAGDGFRNPDLSGHARKIPGQPPFLFKMMMLALAILSPVRRLRRFFTSEPDIRARPMNLAVASLSLTLWFMVGWAGRAIAFV